MSKPSGYWSNDENFDREINLLIKVYGYLPSFRVLISKGRNDIARAIMNRGGFVNLRKKLRLSLTKKTPEYWENWEHIVSEMRDVIIRTGKKQGFWSRDKTLETAKQLYQRYGYLPTQIQLCKLGFGSLSGAASKHFGGLNNLKLLIKNDIDISHLDNQLESLLEGYVSQMN